MSIKSFDERITTRYAEKDKAIYDQVMDIVNEEKLAKSTAQLLLVKRGLQHLGNPEPLIKEKPKVISKPVNILSKLNKLNDNKEHIGEDPKTQQLLSGDKLKTGDKASSSQNALEVKKSPTKHKVNPLLKWGLVGLGVYVCYKVYPLLK